jgi:hypothetical protein
MVLPNVGKRISLLDLQTEFNGTIPIKLSEYYNNSAEGYVKNISGIPSTLSIKLSNFNGKSIIRQLPTIISNGQIAHLKSIGSSYYYIFRYSTGTNSITVNSPINCQILVIGGGGAGGNDGSGGGGGNINYKFSYKLNTGIYNIIIGMGGSTQIGASGFAGNQSRIVFNSSDLIVANGGGGTDNWYYYIYESDFNASYGGYSSANINDTIINYSGGEGYYNQQYGIYISGGGAGAGGNGVSASGTGNTINNYGDGGIGFTSSITKTSDTYAGGGAGNSGANGLGQNNYGGGGSANQRGNDGCVIISFTFPIYGVIIYDDINFNGNSMNLSDGKYYLSNNIQRFNNIIKSVKIAYGYKVILYVGNDLNGEKYTSLENNLTSLPETINNNISSIQVKSLVSIHTLMNFDGLFIYLDVGSYDFTVSTTIYNNNIESIKIPKGHSYKVTCYTEANYTGNSTILYDDTALFNSTFNNTISSIIIEDISGVALFANYNYTGEYRYFENPQNINLYFSDFLWPNDILSSVLIPLDYGYSLILYDNIYSGANVTLTNSYTDLTSINFDNKASSAILSLNQGVRIFKNINLYGPQLYLQVGLINLSLSNWDNIIESISISSGYKVTCYITNNYTGKNIVLTNNVQDLSILGYSNNICSLKIELI